MSNLRSLIFCSCRVCGFPGTPAPRGAVQAQVSVATPPLVSGLATKPVIAPPNQVASNTIAVIVISSDVSFCLARA
jgi:hypothetical protein